MKERFSTFCLQWLVPECLVENVSFLTHCCMLDAWSCAPPLPLPLPPVAYALSDVDI